MSLSRPKFQTFESLDEAYHYGSQYLPKAGATTVRLAPLLLEVPLFSVARNLGGTTIDETWTRKGRGTIRYRGPALTQSHQTFFLALVHLRAGAPVGDIVEFAPHEMLKFMGWSDNGRNIQKLRDMMNDMWRAEIDIWSAEETERDALSVRFFSEKKASTEHGKKWHVSLSDTVLHLFKGHLSQINLRKRAELREGLATFMYGFLCANNGAVPFKFDDLRTASGSKTSRQAAFAEQVVEALETLQAAGCVARFKTEKDSVRVYH